MLTSLEILALAVALALAYIAPQLGASKLARAERFLAAIAARKWFAVVLVGFCALGVRVALLPILPVPAPGIHDEFSHLLLADTLSLGRLANPPHPMWIHFETFHVNQHPTYASMYYPGQGAFLALGQVVFRHPFWGVWLSNGLMCAAICWMLQAWVPPTWALLGGMLAVIRISAFSYWDNTYFGGAVAALGGALVLGSLPRINRQWRMRDALIMGLGLVILANTRPYESLFFCIPVASSLGWGIFGNKQLALAPKLAHVITPLALVLAIGIGATGYYFYRVTGSPFRIPYQVNISSYHLVYFPWQKLNLAATYHHGVMRRFYQGPPVVGQYNHAHDQPLAWLMLKPLPLWIFYFGPALTVPFLIALFVKLRGKACLLFSRKTRLLLLVALMTLIAILLPIYIPPAHYSAPATAAFYALLMQAMRVLRHWRWSGRATGVFLVRAILLICLALLPLRAAASILGMPVPVTVIHTWYTEDVHNLDRKSVRQKLMREPDRHLVFVRYRPDHEVLEEWVYNRADIDGSKIAWARDMGPEANQELIRYYSDRKVWLVEPDEKPVQFSQYDESPTTVR
jgi:hypothetical protein